MLPFITLSTIGVGLILQYVVSVLTPIAVVTGALTAGISCLLIGAAIAITFIILRIAKACGAFEQKYGESSEGDDN